MRIHDGRVTLTDRVQLANELLQLAKSLHAEAGEFRAAAALELARESRVLAELGRGVLADRVDFAKAEAFRDAGELTLQRAIAMRRLHAAVGPGRRSRDNDVSPSCDQGAHTWCDGHNCECACHQPAEQVAS